MGEVYAAEDTKLNRQVALKVLPEEMASQPERVQRFEREAKAVAALDHPNIVTIHSVEEADGVRFITMQLVEGETLSARIPNNGFSLERFFDLAIPMADAISAAHGQGITHRDLKPVNVMVTGEGRVKILDFGLAKLREGVAAEGPTVIPEEPLTGEGRIVGTVAYMSPEQAEGKAVDHRSDIFSLGIILFEMATGERPFRGETGISVISSIMKDTPPLVTELNAALPRHLGRIVQRCLAKDVRQRYQTATDVCNELEGLKRELDSGDVVAPVRPTSGQEQDRISSLRGLAPWGIAIAALALALGLGIFRSGSPNPPAFSFPIERGTLEVADLIAPQYAISRDGTAIAYLAPTQAEEQLFLLRIGQLESIPLLGTEDARGPFFSPDGTQVGFFANGELKRLDLAGGQPLTVCSVPTTDGAADWGEDDVIIFSLVATRTGLLRVSALGGEPKPLTTPDADSGELEHLFPQILPGGDHVLFFARRPGLAGEVQVAHLPSGTLTHLGESAVPAVYVPSGHLLSLESQRLIAAPFDLGRLAPTGRRVPVRDKIIDFRSAGGTLVYTEGDDPINGRALVRIDREGVGEELQIPRNHYQRPRLSPDGKRLAVGIGNAEEGGVIEIHELESPRRRQLPGPRGFPQWADDRRIVSASAAAGKTGIWLQAIDSGDAPRKLVSSEHSVWPTDVSRDGTVALYYEIHPETGRDIWTVSLDDELEARPFLNTSASERSAVFSPNGGWVAYMSDASGQEEVYLRPYPARAPEYQVSAGGGREPRWSADGIQIFYRQGRKMLAVSVETDPIVEFGQPAELFEGRFAVESGGRNQMYDVDSDDNFYMVQVPPGGERLIVVLNWFEELK